MLAGVRESVLMVQSGGGRTESTGPEKHFAFRDMAAYIVSECQLEY